MDSLKFIFVSILLLSIVFGMSYNKNIYKGRFEMVNNSLSRLTFFAYTYVLAVIGITLSTNEKQAFLAGSIYFIINSLFIFSLEDFVYTYINKQKRLPLKSWSAFFCIFSIFVIIINYFTRFALYVEKVNYHNSIQYFCVNYKFAFLYYIGIVFNLIVYFKLLIQKLKICPQIYRNRYIYLICMAVIDVVITMITVIFRLHAFFLAIFIIPELVFFVFIGVNYTTSLFRNTALRYTVDSLSDGLLVYDDENTLVYMNRKFKELVGESLSESFESKDCLDEWASELININNIYLKIIKVNGENHYFNIYRHEFSENNIYIGMSYSLQDISSSIERVQVVEAANENLIEAARQKSDFLANMSHEIRTPMNAVIGMAEMALREDISPAAHKYISQIKSSGSDLLNIINDILDFSKIEAGKMDIIPDDYCLIDELEEISEILKSRIGTKEIEFVLDLDKSIPYLLRGDILRLRQILINLGNNAIKFTNKGKVEISFTYQYIDDENITLFFHMTDTGMGIKKEDLEKIFASFEQVDSKRNRTKEGTGLGLAISKKLIEAMGGSIGVSSVYGSGSDFYFDLPQICIDKTPYIEKADKKYSRNNSNNQDESVFTAPDCKVLIVDDNTVNLTVAKGLLAPLQMNIFTATSGREAIDLAGKYSFDLIFMDHMMPEMDGIEATNLIRSMYANYKDTPIIALTANAVKGAKETLISSGLTDFVAKPISVSDITAKVKEWLPPEKIITTSHNDSFELNNNSDEIINIEGIEFSTAMELIGSYPLYITILKDYNNNIDKVRNELERALISGDYEAYTIKIHALKSSSKQIGALHLSDGARLLEEAGHNNDFEYINQHSKEVLDEYQKLHEAIENYLTSKDVTSHTPIAEPLIDNQSLHILLDKMNSACENLDMDLIEEVINELKKYSYNEEDSEYIYRLIEAAEIMEMDTCSAIIQELYK